MDSAPTKKRRVKDLVGRTASDHDGDDGNLKTDSETDIDELINEITQRVLKKLPPSLSSSSTTLNKSSDDDNNPSSTTKARIIQLKDEVRWLKDVKEKIAASIEENVIQPKLDELSGQFDTYSPLLALGEVPVSHVLSFLNEEELYNCEEASSTIKSKYIAVNTNKASNNLWVNLFHYRHNAAAAAGVGDGCCGEEKAIDIIHNLKSAKSYVDNKLQCYLKSNIYSVTLKTNMAMVASTSPYVAFCRDVGRLACNAKSFEYRSIFFLWLLSIPATLVRIQNILDIQIRSWERFVPYVQVISTIYSYEFP